MKYRPANRKYFEYTDDFLKKAKWFGFFETMKLIPSGFLLYVIVNTKLPFFTFGVDAWVDLILYIVILIVIFRILGRLGRDYSGDEIYLIDDVLYYRKCGKLRMGTFFDYYDVIDVVGVKVTKTKIIIYGKVKYSFGKVDLTFKKLVLPAAIKNVDELIEFARTKADGRSK